MRRLVIVATLLLCCGCGQSNGPLRVAVAGRATLDGTPIAEGTINFLPAGGTKGPTAGTLITDGRYSIAAAKGPCVGRYRVEIRGSHQTGRQVPAPGPTTSGLMVDEIIEIVPSHYNAKTTLEAELKPGQNELDYSLTTK
jgi:hypothetical protein